MYQRKTKDEYVLQGKYCGEWCDIITEDTLHDAKVQLKCYNENELDVPHRIKKQIVRL